jgi:O-antigen/teichoic acid export membrane protein
VNHFFSAEQLPGDLRKRTVQGIYVTTLAQACKFAIQMASIMALARLVAPADFGLVAMVTVITGLLDKFRDGGLSMATIQRPQITQAQVSNLFWINIALGLVLTMLTLIGAPLIAWLYKQPQLINITAAYSTTFFIESAATQHSALLRRKMRFKELAVIDVQSMAVGVAIAIAAAWAGWGYWALVLMPLATSLSRTMHVWAVTQWRPSWFQKGTGVQPMLSFGLHLTGAGLISHLASNLTPFVVGLIGGPLQLGLFNRSNTLAAIPATQILPPITQVLQPALARIANDPARFRRTALTFVRKSCLLAMFVTVIMFMTADWLVDIFLGPGWDGAIIYFRLLSIFAIVQTVGSIVATMLAAQGRPLALFQWTLIELSINAVSVIIGVGWGAMGVVVAYSLSGLLIRLPLLIFFASPYLYLKPSELAKAIFPTAALNLLLLISLVLIRSLWVPSSSFAGASMLSLIAIALYTIGCIAVPSVRIELFQLIKLGHSFTCDDSAKQS